ncbi:TonB-dependent siderophore receptor [Nostoc sp. KVJ3]|uniref:TonB-dependent siderophore receptor n=1 Tax=Nostoc sp. KVJ3 TaxID=457945 RepID=UPI002238DBDA|nr:TonB-dependent siderophore receptor [Nostoc sp. KVJ3]MCW5312707.1 TonB-dependent siderophore receptor [Nostoc sp. KVJ3]
MKLKKLLPYLLLTSSLNVLIATTARSEEVGIGVSEHPKSTPTDANSNQSFTVEPIKEIQRISELVHPAKSAEILRQAPQLSQGDATKIVPVSSVKANPTAKGVEVILQTSLGEKLQLVNRSSGNNFITDIPNAQLRLANGDAFTFRSERPVAGINEITVTNFDANTIRVTVIGDASVPAVELFDSPDEGLIFSVASTASSTSQGQQTQTPQKPEPRQTEPNQPSAPSNEPIEIVVTGEQDGYRVPETSTATRTDTPLRDIPQSIQVVPKQVIQDQGITRISDAARNVSGVSVGTGYSGAVDDLTIRGFVNTNILRNGFKTQNSFIYGANVEQVEVLKGPASVLYGQFEPGGVVNYVTKQPLAEPYYAGEFTAGSYSFYRSSIDISGPLTPDKNLLYRLNIAYENSGNFRDFVNGDVVDISPIVSYKIDDATNISLEYQYTKVNRAFDRGFLPNSVFLTLPISRNLGEPTDSIDIESNRFAVTLDHRFNQNLRLRSSLSGQFTQTYDTHINPNELAADGSTLLRDYSTGLSPSENDDLSLQTDLISEFKTGSVQHQLLFGVEFSRTISNYSLDQASISSLNIFDPIYGYEIPARDSFTYAVESKSTTNTAAIYLQDQVTLMPNLKLLVGGRYDFLNFDNTFISDTINGSPPEKSSFYDTAFSPRVGIVYQPIKPISLYASYSRSFVPNDQLSANGESLPPTKGTQYEVGIKADLSSQISLTLAAYEITKTNVPTADPNNPDFSVAIGEVKSRGIELDIAGEITPGWKVIASGFLNDAFVSEDNDPSVKGSRLVNAPYHGASLWTTYQIQRGGLQGLGFGAGLFFVGDRITNQSDPLTLASYVRTDATIFYKRDGWGAALNFKNLFDVKYYETNGYYVFPQAPFTVQGTISFSF